MTRNHFTARMAKSNQNGRGFSSNNNNTANNRNFNLTRSTQNRPHFKHNPKPFIPHVLFDFVQNETAFPRVKPISANEDKLLNEAIMKRNLEMSPNSNDNAQLLNLINKIQTILDNLVVSPGDFDACHIDEIRQVGSFKKGTMLLSSKLIADICVVLKTLPTKEAVKQLAFRIFDELKKNNVTQVSSYHLNLNEKGFEISYASYLNVSTVDVAVQVMVTTQQQNIKKLDMDLHLDAKQCQLSLNSIKHVRWFEENASHSTIKVLVRLLKDMRSRFEGLQPLNSWLIDLLVQYCVMNNPKREALPLVVAFRRIIQLLSAGLFLPGSAGIIDPCEQSLNRVHTVLNLEQQDMICFTFQTLLRILAQGGYRSILGLDDNSTLTTHASDWNGVVVVPAAKVFEPNKDLIQETKEEMEGNEQAQENNQDTQKNSDNI